MALSEIFAPNVDGDGSIGAGDRHWGKGYFDKLDVSELVNVGIHVACAPGYYARSILPSVDKTVLTINKTWVNIGDKGYVIPAKLEINLNNVENWDNAAYATSANRAGRDMYIYMVQPSEGIQPKIVLSANSTMPTGYNADNSRKVGGFHGLCADVGNITGHMLSGYIAGDILPASIWDLKHRAVSENEGMVYIDGKWYDIYLASYSNGKLRSVFNGVTADGESSVSFHGERFAEEMEKIGKHLLSRDEFIHVAKGSNECTNIAGSVDANTTGGHRDTAGRRMISNHGLEDCCGFLWQWLREVHMHFNATASANTYGYGGIIGGQVANLQTMSEEGAHYMDGYTWQSDGRGTGNIKVDGSIAPYGKAFGALVRLLAGGAWFLGSACGSRSVLGANLSSNRSANYGARGASEPRSV